MAKAKKTIYSKENPGGIIASMGLMQGRQVLRTKKKICPVCLVIYPGQKACCSKECFVKYKEQLNGN